MQPHLQAALYSLAAQGMTDNLTPHSVGMSCASPSMYACGLYHMQMSCDGLYK